MTLSETPTKTPPSWVSEAQAHTEKETRDQPWKKLYGEKVDTGMKDIVKEDHIVALNRADQERLLSGLVEI